MDTKFVGFISDKKNKRAQKYVIICYGNILRSQVLEQYLKHYSKLWNISLQVYSAGIAEWSEFKSAKKLLKEVHHELQKRGLVCSLRRKSWSKHVERKILSADTVLVADSKIKSVVLERMNHRINKEKIYTFYEIISEGEADFQDTYDYEKKRQDPDRFRAAFDELDRIAKKILAKCETHID